MKIMLKQPKWNPITLVVKNELATYQRLVGGYVEAIDVGEGVVMLCDEEGALKQNSINLIYADSVYIFGTVIFVGTDGEDFVSLTADQEAHVRRLTDEQV